MANSTMPDEVVVRSEVQNPEILRDLQRCTWVHQVFANKQLLGGYFQRPGQGEAEEEQVTLHSSAEPATYRRLWNYCKYDGRKCVVACYKS